MMGAPHYTYIRQVQKSTVLSTCIVLSKLFFLGFLGVVDLVVVCGVSTGGPGRGVIGAPGGVIDVTRPRQFHGM